MSISNSNTPTRCKKYLKHHKSQLYVDSDFVPIWCSNFPWGCETVESEMDQKKNIQNEKDSVLFTRQIESTQVRNSKRQMWTQIQPLFSYDVANNLKEKTLNEWIDIWDRYMGVIVIVPFWFLSDFTICQKAKYRSMGAIYSSLAFTKPGCFRPCLTHSQSLPGQVTIHILADPLLPMHSHKVLKA